MPELSCVFTKRLEPESYSHATETEILDALEDVVQRFLENCPTASLVTITDREMKTTETITPQPFLSAIVSVERDPHEDLIIPNTTIVGDMSLYADDVFPVELLGPRYWVVDDQKDFKKAEDRAGTETTGFVNKIVALLDSYVNGRS